MTVGIIGFDERAQGISDAFLKAGVTVFPYAGGGKDDMRAPGADVVILPFPVCKGDRLNAPLCEKNVNAREIAGRIAETSVVLGGSIPAWMRESFDIRGIRYIDYGEYEPYILKNAFYTAEGALASAIVNTDISLMGARCAVLGYGRIGEMTARLLRAFGANVYVFARSGAARAKAQLNGAGTGSIDEIRKYSFDIIFNTIPHRVIDNEYIGKLDKGTVLMELASSPGGFDADHAVRAGMRVLIENGLPGRVSPVSAGRALYESVCEILSEEVL